MYSSTMRELRDGTRSVEASCNGIVQRMVSLPRSILGGVSRRNRNHLQIIPYHQQVAEEFQFLSSFEQQDHPFFYACQMEGPITPAQLIETLQRTMEEKGMAFGSSKRKEQEKKIREEQDVAYLAALQIDKDNERLKTSASDKRVQKPLTAPNRTSYEKLGHNPPKKQHSKFRDSTNTGNGKGHQATQILIRFPNGERREQSFSCADKIESVYRYVDSLGLIGGGSYRLISSFPRKAYPRASLFLELL